jgi:WD40 repeat protein
VAHRPLGNAWFFDAAARFPAILAVFVALVTISTAENGFGQSAPGRSEGTLGRETAPGIAAPEPQRPQNGRFRQLRFSPDGRYILAQHASGVAVLTVEPLSVLFHRSAENVSHAGFTPDSQHVWFVSTPSHVVSPQIAFAGSSAYLERWSIDGATRIDIKETGLRACESSGLSPDSRALACVDTGGTLRLIDVDSGQTIFEKKKFGSTGDRGAADLIFSPDGRFLAAVPKNVNGSTVAWDLRAKAQVKLTGGLRKLESGYHFAFVAPDQVMIAPAGLGTTSVNAMLVEFPSGKVLSKAKLPPGQLFLAADPAYVLIRAFGWFARGSDRVPPAAAVEFRTGQVIIKDAQALDVFGNHYVIEQLTDGKLGLYERGKGVQATVMIDLR